MNRIFIKLSIVLALCYACLICHAQQNHTISFSYDSDGNRVT